MVIQVEKLSKQYGTNIVLDNIDVNMDEGVIYGLVGTNGCGKTTLMRCICGFSHPSSGKITVLGKVVGKDCDFAPSTGIIIEMPGFLAHHSARRNLSILASVSRSADRARIDQAIRMVGLDPEDKKPVGKFSLGMYQRLGIAQAILDDPKILRQHRTIAEASTVESPIRQETIGFPAHFFARAHNFKPPGRACQPEADSPMRT